MRRLTATATALCCLLPLAACGGGGSSANRDYKPLTFGYLTPLRLNVGEVRIEDHVPPPGPDDLQSQSPDPPEQALKQMGQDRLAAAGSSGTAVFTIDQASITGQPGGTLNGSAAVHLDVLAKDGSHAGYAEAHVSRQFTPGTDGGDNGGVRGQLYDLTQHMMQDMNVELEFQVRRTLGDWLVDAGGAPVSDGVQQQNLGGPGVGGSGAGATPAASPVTSTPTPSSVGAPMQLAPSGPGAGTAVPAPASPAAVPPSATGTTGAGTADPAQAPDRSPPPGVLSLPPGATPQGY
ncbi:MAG: hypothetical protein INR65_06130 [Gluconacetobacter diazotrophicus]|nr:hypothetical protein [Gluconacetobacter diazotrophicus]